MGLINEAPRNCHCLHLTDRPATTALPSEESGSFRDRGELASRDPRPLRSKEEPENRKLRHCHGHQSRLVARRSSFALRSKDSRTGTGAKTRRAVDTFAMVRCRVHRSTRFRETVPLAGFLRCYYLYSFSFLLLFKPVKC